MHGEGCDLWVYNAVVWDGMNWTYVLQGKTKPSLGNERRLVMEVYDGRLNHVGTLAYKCLATKT